MNVYIMRLTKDMGLSSTEKLILLLIVDYVNVRVSATTGEIADILGLKTETVYKAINELIQAGLLLAKHVNGGRAIELGFTL